MLGSGAVAVLFATLLGTAAVQRQEDDARGRVLAGLERMETTLDSMDPSQPLPSRSAHHSTHSHADFDLERDPADPFKDIDAKDSLLVATSLVQKALSSMKGSWNGQKKNLRILSQDLEQLSSHDVPVADASAAVADLEQRLPLASALGEKIHQYGFDLEEDMDSLEKLESDDDEQDPEKAAALDNAVSSNDYNDDAEAAVVASDSHEDKPGKYADDAPGLAEAADDELIDDDAPLTSITAADEDEQKSLDDELRSADEAENDHRGPAARAGEVGAGLSASKHGSTDDEVPAESTAEEVVEDKDEDETTVRLTESLNEPVTVAVLSADDESQDSKEVSGEKEEGEDDVAAKPAEASKAGYMDEEEDGQDEPTNGGARAKGEDHDSVSAEQADGSNADQPAHDPPGGLAEEAEADAGDDGEANEESPSDKEVAEEGDQGEQEEEVVAERTTRPRERSSREASVKKSADASLEEEDEDGGINQAVSTSLTKLGSLEEVVSTADIPTDKKTRFLNNIRGLQKDTAVLEKGGLSDSQKVDLQAAMKLRLSMLKDMEEFMSEQKFQK